MASLSSINIRFNADLKGFSSQMQNVQRSLNKTGKQLQNIGSNLSVSVTAPLLGIGALSIKTFADFEDGMAKVKAISGATASEFKLLEANAKKLGETTRFTASEVAALQLNYSKLGFNPSEILQVTEATLQLALATGEDLANSATVAASTLRGFGLDAAETQRVVDVMAASFSGSALNLEKFETAMSVLAPVAKNAGLSLEQATGQLAVLTNAGIDASTAGTGLRNIYLDLAGSGQSFEDAMAQIANSTNKNAEAFNLFGKRGATVAAVLADNYSQAQQFAENFNNAGGSAAKMAAIMDNTVKGVFLRFKSAIEGASISLGEAMAPAIRKATEYITAIIGKFKELSPTTKKWIVILGGIAAAVGPLLALAGTILPAILTGFTILTGPIGLIAAGLTAIGVIIYKNWQPIKKTLIDIANYFIDLYNESTVFRVAVEAVVATFKTLWEIGKFVFEGLKSIIGGFIDNFVTGFKTIGKIIKAVFTGNLGAIPAIIKESSKESLTNFKDLTTNLGNDWNNLIAGIQKVTNDGIANVTSRKKIKFLAENVDATAITDQVATATAKGVVTGLQGATQNGGSGGGFNTPQVSSVNAGIEATGIVNPLGNLLPQLQEQDLQIKTVFASINEGAIAFSEELSTNIQQGLGAAIDVFANFIGNIASGQANIGDLFKGLLGVVAGFLGNLGKALIAAGLASKAFKSLFANPAAAIAAGIALTVLSNVVKNLLVQGPKDAGAFANGGIVGGSSYYGDKLFARVNSGEAIFNREQQKSLYNLIEGPNQQPIVLNGGFKITGDTLQLMIDRALLKRERRS